MPKYDVFGTSLSCSSILIGATIEVVRLQGKMWGYPTVKAAMRLGITSLDGIQKQATFAFLSVQHISNHFA